ncbi:MULTISPECIES: LacI family DNA-binding transcriptional regulator [Micromonospora]|uniref:LacI family transcriptional regulator n=1 Tax=Micromonospora solifontis TaxID=2487138 RepID=A0ABX9WC73_9ACTN|nr:MULTISPECIES: substrate-binding domain-containing protein [Micromonospora]NES16304.1 LacI family transcriptional regulator [Micromonospora sp. PPF5-17B]NES38364.1 LacI family transcriptional regulator [Micromonospora solifontis]NES58116.1 LacI family transcriptional regulator [Micromonospora sp. PPF5-6]RNL95901.1 LacI family transcriptional regulator [Micromonospora solifontis]
MSATSAVGLVLARAPRLLGAEPFFMEFIAGIEERLAERGRSVLLHIVADHAAEVAAYRRWARQRLVDAVVLVNPTAEDSRPQVLHELGLPVVVAGDPDGDTPAVRRDDVGSVRAAVAHLAGLGHRRIARVSGPDTLRHTRTRTAALLAAAGPAGIDAVVLAGDYSAESGAALTARLLDSAAPPSAIIYDNDLMAVAGLNLAKELGLRIPRDLSLLAWDDSSLCRLASPPLTTMSLDVHRFGELVARSVLALLDGEPVRERWCPTETVVVRQTTAPPSTDLT